MKNLLKKHFLRPVRLAINRLKTELLRIRLLILIRYEGSQLGFLDANSLE
ncbi:hypothetical protein SAMN05192553_101834 [Cyclobacterium xiamenense]|uniref:Uncharacterized protein n=1 Tax=Cyclobacterium xiamenense TaxID=1297121 RepID=A0A1H6ULV0_9BACT|nr:hypothetical protein SAMN05192553_101834 [Cyclobacterium xiamenense]